ncbi:MAG: biotin transporter BioY [Lachnospiraceae bacterium]|nr:biotin transporter BioY [Lachnospiraceae bacterium]
MTQNQKLFTLPAMAMMALFAAITCILAPLSISIGPVPISFTNLAIYFSLYLLGWKEGTITYCVYLLIGLIGLPVFSGFTGGVGKLAGPTGGYLIGFIPMSMICGFFIEKFHKKIYLCVIGMILGTMVAYTFGTIWFCYSTGTGVVPALGLCVFPVLPGDLVKIVLTGIAGPFVAGQIKKAVPAA